MVQPPPPAPVSEEEVELGSPRYAASGGQDVVGDGRRARNRRPTRRRLMDLCFEVKDNLETVKYWLIIAIVLVILVRMYAMPGGADEETSKKLSRHLSRLLRVINTTRLDNLMDHLQYTTNVLADNKEEVPLLLLTTPIPYLSSEDYDHASV
jgi:hypothetical protein